jgi:hypothetical protein
MHVIVMRSRHCFDPNVTYIRPNSVVGIWPTPFKLAGSIRRTPSKRPRT